MYWHPLDHLSPKPNLNPIQALDYLERALALCQEVGDLIGQAHSLRLLAYLHFAQVNLTP